MAWRIAGQRVNRAYRSILAGTGGIASTDIGKLVELSSQVGVLYAGTTSAIPARSILGIVAVVPDNATAGSTTLVYVQPITPGELVEVDYSTDSSIIASTNDVIGTTSIGYWFRAAGAGTSSGDAIVAGYLDPSTAQKTLAASTVGLFQLEGFSTERKTALGRIASTVLAP